MASQSVSSTDFLVLGGGIIGVSVARELKIVFATPGHVVGVEVKCGLYASGRNSGVIHAGFYYSADSLKAKLTRQNRAMIGCEAKNIR
jgi:L-2-hydroxyglutarate oxidase LhgO